MKFHIFMNEIAKMKPGQKFVFITQILWQLFDVINVLYLCTLRFALLQAHEKSNILSYSNYI